MTDGAEVAVPTYNVAILHESPAAGQRAKAYSDQLATTVAAERILSLSQWDFRSLGRRAVCNAAARAAAVAAVVILSISGKRPLPAPVERWVEMWTWLIDGRKPVVVAIFETHDPESAHPGLPAAGRGQQGFNVPPTPR